jgi:hypothetical protein
MMMATLVASRRLREARIRYYGKEESPLWVEVVISKINGSIEARKYRGEGSCRPQSVRILGRP